jgi:Mg-chelatase subunit ChlD
MAALSAGLWLGRPVTAHSPAAAPPAAPRQTGALETYTLSAQWPERKTATTGVLQQPVGLDIGPDDRIYVSDAGAAGVHVVLPTGQFVPPFGTTGPEEARLRAAGRLSVDQVAGRVYVLDTGSDRVVVYDLDGQYLANWPRIAGAGIAAVDGRIYVAERETNQIQVFDDGGKRLYAFGRQGTGDGQFTGFTDVSVSEDGKVLAVGDMQALRVQLFDVSATGATFRRAYPLNAPKYSPPKIGTLPSQQCRATVVNALGGDDVWVGDGTGACRLTPRDHTYTIATSMGGGTICKNTVRLPRIRPTTGQFVAVATYDPNAGPCQSLRGGKGTGLATTPAVVTFLDPDLRRTAGIFLSSADSLNDRGLVSPDSVSVPVPDGVFVQDASSYGRFFAPDGARRGTVALTTRQGAGTTERYVVEIADGAAQSGAIVGYYHRSHRGKQPGGEGLPTQPAPGNASATPTTGAGSPTPTGVPATGTPNAPRPGAEPAPWIETEHGIGLFRSTTVREHGRDVDVLDIAWTNPFSLLPPEAACLRGRGARDSLEVVDVAYNNVTRAALALVFERVPTRRLDDAYIEAVPADGSQRTKKWDLPDDHSTTAVVNPYIDLSVGPDGRVYALNDYADVVEVLAPDGTKLGRIPVASDVKRIAGGPGGVLFGLREPGYVERYAFDGTVTARFDGRPYGESDPSTLTGIAADETGRVYTSDAFASVISVFEPAAPGTGALPVPADATCLVAGDKTASPTALTLGDTTRVTLALSGRCGVGEEPADIILTTVYLPPSHWYWLGCGLDDPAALVIKDLRELVSRIDFSKHRVGIVSYLRDTTVELPLTSDPTKVLAAIQGISRRWPQTCPGQNCASNLRDALQTAQGQFDPASTRRRVVLLFQPDYCNRDFEYSDGECRGYPPAEDQAKALRDAGTQIVVFDGQRTGYRAQRLNGSAYVGDAQPLASSDADAVLTYGEVQHRMVHYQVPEFLATGLLLVDTLPANMRLVPGSVSPPGVAAGTDVTWDVPQLPFQSAPFTLDVQPQQVGHWPTNVEASASFTDGWGRPGRVVFPVPHVDVVAPTATPTATFEPTATARPPTATASPVPTGVPRPVHLPIVFRDQCVAREQHVDVALVVDTSSSMAGAKVAAAQASLRVFLDVLNLAPDRDRVTLVAFNETAALVQPLTADRAALGTAIDGLTTHPGTRIDLGLELALDELTGPDRRPENKPIVVLLSDGWQEDTAPVLAAGTRARGLGVEVFTIGLGADADGGLLAAIASDASHYHFAPTPDELAAIYRRIAGTIPCR